jgi:hypothetical protein
MAQTNRILFACMVVAGFSLFFLVCLATQPAYAADAGSDTADAAPKADTEEPDDAATVFCTKVFRPVLAPIFVPINRWLGLIPDGAAGYCGIGLFVCAMIWVGLILNKDYVNRGRPYKSLATDLRVWTVISMTPHVLFYFYFR